MTHAPDTTSSWGPRSTLPVELGDGTEVPVVAHLYDNPVVAPGAHDFHNLYIVYFPRSHRTAVFWLIQHEL